MKRARNNRSMKRSPSPTAPWPRSSTRFAYLRVGDLVTVVDYCADHGRLAIITELPDTMYRSHNGCKIQWIDEAGLRDGPVAALLRNIEKIDPDDRSETG